MKNKEQKKLIFNIFILFVIFLISFYFITLYINKIYKKLLFDFSDVVITNINEKYPDAEEEVIKDIFIKNFDKSYNSILNNYGINEENIEIKYGNIYFSNMIYILVIISIIIFLILILLIIINYLKNQDKNIDKLNNYANQVLLGDYKLMISDNDESSLSMLENKIYDMTVMLKEKSENLLEDKEKLEKLLADISHQIKTPLTSLNLLNDLLYQDLPEDKRKEFLDNMQNELKKIEWLIKNLLYLAKLDAKMIEFKKEYIDIKKLINESINEFSVLAEVSNVNITVNCEDKIFVKCDAKWTKEAINNLIKNSIEHLTKNIRINIITNYLYTQIEVIDDGEGIKKEDIKNIFKRFYKANNSKNSSLGLGLAFVKGIVESQNGSIKVKSKENEYTKFIIKLYKINTK